MILGGDYIRALINSGAWTAWKHGVKVSSDSLKIGPNSVDVSLGNTLLRVIPTGRDRVIDPNNECSIKTERVFIDDEYLLHAGEFILGYARERFDCAEPVYLIKDDRTLPHYYTQMYDGRSTMGRLGIISHVTAGYGDLGFAGNFTLEFVNHSKNIVKLYSGMRIGQVSFVEVEVPPGKNPIKYSGKYEPIYDCPVGPILGRENF